LCRRAAGYEPLHAEKTPAIGGERLVVREEIPKRWWEVFHNKNSTSSSRRRSSTIVAAAAESSIKMAYFAAEAQKGGFLQRPVELGRHYNFQSPVQNTVTRTPRPILRLFLRQLTISYTRTSGARTPRRRIA